MEYPDQDKHKDKVDMTLLQADHGFPSVFPIISPCRLRRKRGKTGKREQKNRQTGDEIVTMAYKKKQNVDKRNKMVYDVRAFSPRQNSTNKAGAAF